MSICEMVHIFCLHYWHIVIVIISNKKAHASKGGEEGGRSEEIEKRGSALKVL